MSLISDHRVGGGSRRVHVSALSLVQVRPREQFGNAKHTVHRRADLVTHVRQELVLARI